MALYVTLGTILTWSQSIQLYCC